MQTGSPPEHVDGKPDEGEKEHRPNAAVPEAGEIRRRVQESECGIGHVDEQGPGAKPEKPIPNGKMKRWGLCLGQEARHALGSGAEDGEGIVGIGQNDEQIRQGREEKQPAQITNVVCPLPSDLQGFHLARRDGERGFIGLKTPPRRNEQQTEKEPGSRSANQGKPPGDDS